MKRSDFFSRQIILKGFGEVAQYELSCRKVAVVGMGGLGCPVAIYLAAAGVGELILIEGDKVEKSNLHRQILFDTGDIGEYKCEVAGRKLEKSYPFSRIQVRNTFLTRENASFLISGVDLVVDGTDDQSSKFMISDVSRALGLPVLYGAVDGFDGQIALFENARPEDEIVLRDLFSEEDDSGLIHNCSESGVLGPVAGLIGVEMALEAVKFLTGTGESLSGKLKLIDTLEGKQKIISLGKKQQAEMLLSEPDRHLTERTVAPEIFDEITASENCLVLDVRTCEEFNNYNRGGVNIPLIVLSERAKELSKDNYYILVCEKGIRSKRAASILKSHGFDNLYILEGGLRALTSENKSHHTDDFCN